MNMLNPPSTKKTYMSSCKLRLSQLKGSWAALAAAGIAWFLQSMLRRNHHLSGACWRNYVIKSFSSQLTSEQKLQLINCSLVGDNSVVYYINTNECYDSACIPGSLLKTHAHWISITCVRMIVLLFWLHHIISAPFSYRSGFRTIYWTNRTLKQLWFERFMTIIACLCLSFNVIIKHPTHCATGSTTGY